MVRVKQCKLFKEPIGNESQVQAAQLKIEQWLDQKALLDTYYVQQSVSMEDGKPYLVVSIWYTVLTGEKLQPIEGELVECEAGDKSVMINVY